MRAALPLVLLAAVAAAETPRGGPLLFVSYPERDRAEAAVRGRGGAGTLRLGAAPPHQLW